MLDKMGDEFVAEDNEGHPAPKDLVFMGNSLKVLRRFPIVVRDVVGQALYNAQNGADHPDTKALKGFGGARVREIVSRASDGTFRVVYTTMIAKKIVVLHAFQKKSTKGIATPKKEMDVVKARLKEARERLG